MTFKKLILHICTKVNKERSPSAAYHVLTGKKSGQTLQDISLFQIEHFFGLLPDLEKQEVDSVVDELVVEKVITLDDGIVHIQKPKQIISLNSSPFCYLNGEKFHRVEKEFYSSLLLLTQSISHLIYNKNRFIPIVEDRRVQSRVKQIISQPNNNAESLAEKLYLEMHRVLLQLPEEVSNMYLSLMSRENYIGLTFHQLAEKRQVNFRDIQLEVSGVNHFIMQEVIDHPEDYSILRQLFDQKVQTLTNSASITYEYLKQDMDLNSIANLRNLKLSTIEDHVVEIATRVQTFQIENFISDDTKQKIIESAMELKTMRLRLIKEHLDDSCSYFQIRLVLTQIGELESKG
ncbi:hypothetical protein CEY16_03735 [Halalkalibacillus sediminis]|uniref:Helicase Helix-turn-helix domain-containing protein n=1 Tax=Halalkalibacillus sediminis TaxID=2018042 RepID=A0A2I0QX40_9BACI|nr:helix-turn-helix domain-containing protein [Halalkalibacillus sediminis]PKR78878.1 hypothetical protein CEY16_03735 [Halalkalibacillus sediminis]